MEVDDNLQQAIVEWHGSAALVLAGPGCGKTHILARRIFHAGTILGVPFYDMLCVTFTNRAAREMMRRIHLYLGERPHDLFVGNIHRFCLRFLYENGIITPETSVLDDEDRREYLASLGIIRAGEVKDFLEMYAYVYQRDNDHPEWIRRRPHRMPDARDRERIECYANFKTDNSLVDFDDILLLTYTALDSGHTDSLKMTGYRWVQVDEVQDMTPLQLAIVERVTASPEHTCLFLGDEQQAIFNFTGAGGRALDAVKRMCKGKILSLGRNYRSPKYLVELCNNLATAWLNINSELLPSAVRDDNTTAPLTAYMASAGNLRVMAAATARRMLAENPGESVTILTRTNGEGDDVAYTLRLLGIDHFHISKQDVFHQLPFKTIWAHLAAVATPSCRFAWTRLLYQTGAVKTLTASRSLVHTLRDSGINAAELLATGPTAIERFAGILSDSGRTMVILDTETSGLDIFSDDVVQIAAVKMRGGSVVPGSEFEVFISSDKHLPLTLSDGCINPLAEEYRKADKVMPEVAFRAFSEYIGTDAVICGHNVGFDTAILINNIKRRTDLAIPHPLTPDAETVDTLALAQALMPSMRSHRLGFLSEAMKLDGSEFHNARADVAVTVSLVSALLPMATAKIPAIKTLMADPAVQRTALRFRKYYADFYFATRQRLKEAGGSLANEVKAAHTFFTTTGATSTIEHLDYILQLIDSHIVDSKAEPHLRDQLSHHLYDLITYHESDLFADGIVQERLSVMTVHKAKGLEADNVIMYDASSSFGTMDDRARLLYVAFSRARRRLAIGMSCRPDAILLSVLRYFRTLTPREIAVTVNAETLNFKDDPYNL